MKKTVHALIVSAAAQPPLGYRRSNLDVSGVRMVGDGPEHELVADDQADGFAVLLKDRITDGRFTQCVEFFALSEGREAAENYVDLIAREG